MRCFACLREIAKGSYCRRCRLRLFEGRSVVPLRFDKSEFYRRRRELADRLSISGVQDKISLRFGEEGALEPTDREGLYILKPAPRPEELDHPEDLPANEHLSMLLARELFGIPTALSALIEFSDGELAYITRRFDYVEENGRLCKLDQEDFASILERTSENHGGNYKYDASYEACARAIRNHVAAYLPALEDFYRRILFNYLIGNADAHLKNFSIYRPQGRRDWSLTPAYDLLFTRYHLPTELGYMGLELFEDETETESFKAMGYYTLEDFLLFAEKIGLPPRRLPKIFDHFLRKTPEVIEKVQQSFLSPRGKRAYAQNYLRRLKLHLCYSVPPFRAGDDLRAVIEKYEPMIAEIYARNE